LSARAIEAAIRLAHRFPEKRGLITDALGAPRKQAARYHVLESHIDAASVPAELADRLVSIGFEPDDFVQFLPARFSRHFTLKFVVDKAEVSRRSRLRREIDRRTKRAIALISRWPGVEAYVEVETYSSQTQKRFTFAVPSASDLAAFPLPKNALRSRIATDDVHKEADIHIKTPLPERGAGYELANAPQMQALRERLLEAGFYEVITPAANKIYTAQFESRARALQIFETLVGYFAKSPGAVEICFEPCVKMWRSQCGARLAEVPPLVS
jgi:hypothetical protein